MTDKIALNLDTWHSFPVILTLKVDVCKIRSQSILSILLIPGTAFEVRHTYHAKLN